MNVLRSSRFENGCSELCKLPTTYIYIDAYFFVVKRCIARLCPPLQTGSYF